MGREERGKGEGGREIQKEKGRGNKINKKNAATVVKVVEDRKEGEKKNEKERAREFFHQNHLLGL